MSPKRSRVYPPYKTKYRVSNSAECDRAFVSRRSIPMWLSDGGCCKDHTCAYH